MEEIEVNIKLAANNQIYNLAIRKSDTILKLKEYCQIISNIPPAQQALFYKGKILSNEKLINEYDIETNHNIILVKKEELKPVNIKNFSDNKEINPNEVAKALEQFPDLLSFFEKVDFNMYDNYCRSFGLGSFSSIYGIEPQEFKEMLKDPSNRDILKNISNDPSSLETFLSDPELQKKFQDKPFLKLSFQYPKIFMTPHYFQMYQNMFKVKEKNIIESSNSEISLPPDPFESLNDNQDNQIMNSSGQKSNINFFNHNNTGNKEILGNNGIDIDYKKEYKDQLSQLKDMGFINEETNIQVLKQSKGNINNAIENLLKYN